MKLWKTGLLGIGTLSLSLVMVGCGGDGGDAGVPEDLTPGVEVTNPSMSPKMEPSGDPKKEAAPKE